MSLRLATSRGVDKETHWCAIRGLGGLMPTAGKGLLALFGQLLAPVIQGAIADSQVARDLAHGFAAAFDQPHRLQFELLGVRLLLFDHLALLR